MQDGVSVWEMPLGAEHGDSVQLKLSGESTPKLHDNEAEDAEKPL